jgi:hypothetical protein
MRPWEKFGLLLWEKVGRDDLLGLYVLYQPSRMLRSLRQCAGVSNNIISSSSVAVVPVVHGQSTRLW